MLTKERQQAIAAYLKQNQSISVRKITEEFYVSEATARRDLKELEKSGLVRRIFGGAMLNTDGNGQVPLYVREREESSAKSEIAQKAVSLIHDGDIVLLDGSSTVAALAKQLYRFKDLTVVTNGIKTAQIVSDMHIRTYMTGGSVIDGSSVLAGHDAEQFVKNHHADICFVSCKGLDEEGFLSDTSERETSLRKVFLQQSETKVLLITQNKYGRKYFCKLCHVSDVDYLLSDGDLPVM